jgi:tRNA-dihydrouridine synthase B
MTFSPLKIGSVEIGSPVVQAALSGYSDWPMRVLARRHGASYVLCEVMLDQFLVTLRERQRTSHFLHNSAEERPVAGQLMGAEPDQFALGAQKLVEAGFDVIDINFGCPVKKVLGRCRGGFHLSQPKVALEIIRRTREVVPDSIPVTVKMRRGIDDTSESRDHFFEILEGAFEAGLAAATIHGRTVKQRYVGPSRWEFLKEVKTLVGDRIILGSGDLFTIGNPWIFEQALALMAGEPLPAPPTLWTQREVIREHYRLAESLYGEQRCGTLMRKFGIKYSALHPDFENVRSAFVKVRNREDWDNVLRVNYAEDLPGCYPEGRLHQAMGSCENA